MCDLAASSCSCAILPPTHAPQLLQKNHICTKYNSLGIWWVRVLPRHIMKHPHRNDQFEISFSGLQLLLAWHVPLKNMEGDLLQEEQARRG
jgi:hypothetical protein